MATADDDVEASTVCGRSTPCFDYSAYICVTFYICRRASKGGAGGFTGARDACRGPGPNIYLFNNLFIFCKLAYYFLLIIIIPVDPVKDIGFVETRIRRFVD